MSNKYCFDAQTEESIKKTIESIAANILITKEYGDLKIREALDFIKSDIEDIIDEMIKDYRCYELQ